MEDDGFLPGIWHALALDEWLLNTDPNLMIRTIIYFIPIMVSIIEDSACVYHNKMLNMRHNNIVIYNFM